MKWLLPILAGSYCAGYLVLMYLIGISTGVTMQGQAGHPSLVLIVLHLLSVCCSWGLVVAAAVYTLYMATEKRFLMLPFGLASIALPFFTHKHADELFHYARSQAEQREILSMEPAELRSASTQLVEALPGMTNHPSYFGRRVETNRIPAALLRFTGGETVEVNEHGVVFRTHGLGSWRGGYLITPEESEYEPESGRKIMDGFYYVISQ